MDELWERASARERTGRAWKGAPTNRSAVNPVEIRFAADGMFDTLADWLSVFWRRCLAEV